MKTPKWVQHWDDERNLGHGIIVTLHYGWSFAANEHQGVQGFDTVTDARDGVKKENLFQCKCENCAPVGEPPADLIGKAQEHPQ